MGEKGNDQLVVDGQEEKLELQNPEMEREEEKEEEEEELNIVGQQRVAIPEATAAENAPVVERKQEVTNNRGTGGSGSKDSNYDEMIREMEALGQKLRKPVPVAQAEQRQIAGELRTNCASIIANANSYIRSQKFSVSKSARASRRYAQEVSGKCQNDARNLYIIMRNAVIQGQITWEQVLAQTTSRINQQPTNNVAQPAVPAQPTNNVAQPAVPAQPTNNVAQPAVPAQPANNVAQPAVPAQPANNVVQPVVPAQPENNAVQPEAQAQPAGMQIPQADNATDFARWKDLLETSEKGGLGLGNSKYFNRVLEGIRNVGNVLQGRFGNYRNDNIKRLGAARIALQGLLEACMTYTARKPKTEKGKARKRIVEQLQEYVAQDIKGCSDAMDAFFRMPEDEMAAETWETVLRSARSVKISVPDFSKLETPKAGMASEVVILHTETGTKYFKKEDSTDLDEFRGSDDMVRDIALKETLAKYGEIPEVDKKYIPILIDNRSTVKEQDYKDVSEKGKPALKFFLRRYKQLKVNIDENGGVLGLKDMGGKLNLSRRNVATSRIASLLELKGLIAESKTVDILDEATGKTIHGNLMNQAEGKEYNDISKSLRAKEIRPSFIREITSLQVLDLLCGQIDRHSGNMMYKVDDEGYITGVQGIDNDASFGLKTGPICRGAGIFDSSGEEMMIPYMDAGLADRIVQLDGKMLRYVLVDLLKEEEIDMAIKRLEGLQKGIKNIREKEAFRFLEKKEDWTLHKNHNQAKENIKGSGWDNVQKEEKANPELEVGNGGQGRSVESSFYYYSEKYDNMSKNKQMKRKMAEEMYGESDPNRLKLLLQYIEDRSMFEHDNETKVMKEEESIKEMYKKVLDAIKEKYKNPTNYFVAIVSF